jgi:RHS repeat-associated protein
MTSAANRFVSLLIAALLGVAIDSFSAALAFGANFTTFGPRLYERGTGTPVSVPTQFIIPNPSKPYTLKIYNGGRADLRTGERVSNAIISLNGAVIVGAQNLNEKISEFSVPIKVLASNNLSVELRGKPGGLLVVEIIGMDNAPVANAGADQTLLVGSSAQLDGSGSSDVDGDLLTFQWTFVSRPAGSSAVLSDPTAVKPFFVIDRPGNYELRLTVNDGLVDSAPDNVTISTQNSRPIAYAGPDQTITLGGHVFLDGRGSSDIDGDPLIYRWRIISKPQNSTAALDLPATSQPTFIADKPGSYTIELIVNDGALDSNADQVIITTENSRPVADAGPDIEAFVGDMVHLDGSNSFDADNDPLTYQWSFTSKPDSSAATLSDGKIFNPTFIPDVPGLYVLQLIVSDGKANSLPDTASITIFVPAPPNRNPVANNDSALTAQNTAVTITVLGNDFDPDGDPISITSVTQGANGTVTHNGSTTTYTPKNNFGGDDSFTYTISDGKGGFATATVTVTVNSPPIVDAGPNQIITLPSTATLAGSAKDDGIPNPPGALTLTWSVVSGPAAVVFSDASAANSTATFSHPGTYVLRLKADDGMLNRSDDVQITVRPARTGEVPPDPSTIAPPIDPTVATSIDKSTDFLYTGPDPIQTGVAPGTINPIRAAVVRGKVMTRDDAPLAGVLISIHNHPEFGQTLSRADGMFDMVVNGGGLMSIDYQKTGFLPAQRQVHVPWQNYAVVSDVVMIPRDTQVTTITANAAVAQIARGSVVTDSDGTRQVTILFPQGTGASIVLPDGTLQPVPSLSVRATEYTIGANGPQAMPAELPPTSGYTYAIELSADEAAAKVAGRDVVFTQPVPVYVENFLGFPVGGNVPVGYYDRDRSAWVPSDNGRVIKITAITNGLATVDTMGTGSLPPLALDAAERQQLAGLYTVGQELWRSPLPHFSTWDLNWGVEPDCDPSTQSCAPQDGPKDENPLDDPCQQSGSVIGCENQSLGESVAVTGTPWRLHYQSQRTPGRRATFDIPLSGAQVPPRLQRIELEIQVAGRLIRQSFAPTPNQRTTFVWDGMDVYGRKVQGSVPITVRTGYTYNAVYQQTSRFGYAGNGVATTGFGRALGARQQLTLWRGSWQGMIGPWDARAAGLGGLDLGVHHAYDNTSGTLLLGDGRDRRAVSVGLVMKLVTSSGDVVNGGIGGANKIAAAADGTIYLSHGNGQIWRNGVDGITTRLETGYPANLATGGIALAQDGTLYFSDDRNNVVRRRTPDGVVTTYAGNGIAGFSGDGGPAIAASLWIPEDLALGPDGSLFINDRGNGRVRRVAPDGTISTYAGNGSQGYTGDGGPAVAASFSAIQGMAAAPDGSLYVADGFNFVVRRISPSGIITRVAGTGTGVQGFSGDGGPATAAQLVFPYSVAVAPDGSLLIADYTRVRQVGVDGVINTIAGNGKLATFFDFVTDGAPAKSSSLGDVYDIAVAPDRSLIINLNNGFFRVLWRAAPALPGFSLSEMLLPSEDGRELYTFNASGRHLTTRDSLTGALRYQFGYDAGGYLTSITDGTGNVTTIERSGATPTAIIAPGGQRTTLAVNSDGWLASVANPAGEAHNMSYSPDGLLQTFTDPRGNVHRYFYDSLGRLIRDEDPAGGSTALARTELSNGHTVSTTTALGRTRTYQVERLSTGVVRRTVTDPSGIKTVSVKNPDGSEQTTYADGSSLAVTYGPDPRFGMLAPVARSIIAKTPSGLTRTITTTRTATLADPNNLLSLTNLTDTVSDNGKVSTRVYNGTTRTITQTTPAGRSSTVTLDTLGRVTQAQALGLDPVTFTYDSRGLISRVTEGSDAASRTISLAYNAAYQLTGLTDALGQTLGLAYDGAGRLVTQTQSDGRTVAFAYDAAGNTTSITPPGRSAHSFGYTAVDQMSSYTPPDVGGGSTETLYSYDADHAPTRKTLADGQLVEFTYDMAGRASSLGISRGVFNFTYDPTTSQLTGVSAPGGLGLSYSYDGDMLTGVTWSGTVTGSTAYTYNNDLRMTAEKVNGANTVSFAYDADGLLTSAGNLALTHNLQNGLRTGSTLGSVTDSLTYNTMTELSNYSASYSTSVIYSAAFTRDALGRITQKVETVSGTTATYAYSYDLAGRLIEVKQNGLTTASYTYDSNGNRTARTGPTVSASYDGQDRLTSYGGTTYNYTANGELLSKTVGALTTSYQYDALGNLLKVTLPGGTAIDYLVDGRNRRIGKKVNGSLVQGFLYQGTLRPIAELDGNNAIVSRFVYATQINVPDYMVKGGVTYRIITDHLGSPRLVVDAATGTVAQRIDYDEFGQVLNDTNPGFQPFGFAGGLYDPDTKLVRFGARDYDAEAGRWTSKDPILFAGGDTSFYAYVSNNPVSSTDISGLKPNDPIYNTPYEAAVAALNEMLPLSVAKGWEYGTQILKDAKSGKYYYLTPVTQKNPKQVTLTLKRGAAAICHTHPRTNIIPMNKKEDPADYSGPISNYTAGSEGSFWLIEPGDQKPLVLGGPNFISTGRSPDPGSPTPSGFEFLNP